MRALVGLSLIAACYSPHPPAGAPCSTSGACPSGLSCIAGYCEASSGGGDGAPRDTSMIDHDAGIDAAGCGFSTRHFDGCALPAPIAVHLTAQYGPWAIDTGATPPQIKGRMNMSVPFAYKVIDQNGITALVISATSFTLDAQVTLRATGTRPLIIAADTIDISGILDVSATGTGGGAGSNPGSLCGATAPAPGVSAPGGAGGGGGGAFQGAGGHGGPGDMDTGPHDGGGGGAKVAVPTIVRGGCPGGAGGNAGGGAATGGSGGGAIQLTARSAILVSGSIDASGGGAAGGVLTDGGGAGGGAGGYVGLDAPAIGVTGRIGANGGGGGQGATATAGAGGTDGQLSFTQASGGNNGSCGFAGGRGAAGAILDGESVVGLDACGGGGGGGGAGYVLVWGPLTTGGGVISPPVLDDPF